MTLIDPFYPGLGQSPWQAMVDARRDIALQVISRCEDVRLLSTAWGLAYEAGEEWRMAAITARTRELCADAVKFAEARKEAEK